MVACNGGPHNTFLEGGGGINIFQHAPQGSEGPIDDIPRYIFKPVNHFCSYAWAQARDNFFVSDHKVQKSPMFMPIIFLYLVARVFSCQRIDVFYVLRI